MGMKKELTAGRKTRLMPLTTPGRDSGKVTRIKVCTSFAPRSLLAARRDLSILQRELVICKIIKGRKL